ncbi:hypothetical protein EIQ28_03385 [Xanthomonas campestris pv. plantaginis]
MPSTARLSHARTRVGATTIQTAVTCACVGARLRAMGRYRQSFVARKRAPTRRLVAAFVDARHAHHITQLATPQGLASLHSLHDPAPGHTSTRCHSAYS